MLTEAVCTEEFIVAAQGPPPFSVHCTQHKRFKLSQKDEFVALVAAPKCTSSDNHRDDTSFLLFGFQKQFLVKKATKIEELGFPGQLWACNNQIPSSICLAIGYHVSTSDQHVQLYGIMYQQVTSYIVIYNNSLQSSIANLIILYHKIFSCHTVSYLLHHQRHCSSHNPCKMNQKFNCIMGSELEASNQFMQSILHKKGFAPFTFFS